MSGLSPKFKRNLTLILPFGLIWLIMGWVFLWTEYAVYETMDKQTVSEAVIDLTPKLVLFASISVFSIGCVVGLVEVTFINQLFARSSFPQKFIGKFLIYTAFIFTVIFIFYMLAASIEMSTSVFDPEVFDRYKSFLFSVTNVSTSIQIAFSLILSLLYEEIRDNLGQNVLLNFFTGRYHRPKQEQRIFMFTDMKSSTAIAEQLGHETYFDFLKDYYNDLSDAIINYHGEVYQYVGDEIVITWKLQKKNAVANSINCFFSMKASLAKRRNRYLKTYGISPDFKGALHLGEVTTGEIGALKRDIFFTGDVLNTTARIQTLCREYQTDLLLSSQMLDHFETKQQFKTVYVGQTELKGKQEPIELYSIL